MRAATTFGSKRPSEWTIVQRMPMQTDRNLRLMHMVICWFSECIRSQGYKTFSCSTQMSMTFQLLIKSKMLKNEDSSCFGRFCLVARQPPPVWSKIF